MEKIEMDSIQILIAVLLILSAMIFVTYEVTALAPLSSIMPELVEKASNMGNQAAALGSGLIEGFIGWNPAGGE